MNPMNKVIATEVLKDADRILKANEVEYFLIYGTCLGAIRDQNFVETDTDIDLGVKHELLIPKIKKLMNDFREDGFIVYGFSHPYPYLRALNIFKNGILIDIRNFEKHGDTRFLQRINSDRVDVANTYKAEWFDNLKEIEFRGMTVKVPNPPEEYLTRNYGDWRTPDPNFHESICGKWGFWEQELKRETWILDDK
jgi:phosphorylcholine metabolism protein LicD